MWAIVTWWLNSQLARLQVEAKVVDCSSNARYGIIVWRTSGGEDEDGEKGGGG